jgi:hypothetical protein
VNVFKRLATAAGTLLLAASVLAALYGVCLVGWLLVAGLTGPGVVAAMVAFGVALSAGLTGLVVRRRAAGTLLPSDVDLSVEVRGGQGGL